MYAFRGRTSKCLLLILTLCFFSGTGFYFAKQMREGRPVEPVIVFFDGAIQAAYLSCPVELERHKPAFDVEGRGRLNSCQSILHDRDPREALEAARELMADYAPCFLLDALRHATPSRQSHFDHGRLGPDLRDHLVLTSFASSLGPRHLHVEYKFGDLKPSNVSALSQRLTVETTDWFYDIRIVAATDVDGDGNEDLLALFFDEAKDASYKTVAPLIFTRSAVNGPILAKEIAVAKNGTRRR